MTTQSPALKRRVLIASIFASSMGFLMQSVTVALPAIQAEFNATGAQALWIINGYLLFLGALILVGGAMGDLYGRNRIFGIGVIGFGVTSVLCGIAPSIELLIVARLAQGVLGALMIPNSLALLTANFDGAERGQAIGAWSALTTLASVLGPIIGGLLVDNGLWRGIFLLGLPFALVSLWALRAVPESHSNEAPHRLDWLGASLITLSLASFVFSAMRLSESIPSDPTVWGSLLVGIISAVAFIAVEMRVPFPLLRLELFKSSTFSGTNAYTFFIYGALASVTTFATVYLVAVRGFDATTAGIAFLPITVAIIVLSPYAARLSGRVGARMLLVVGGVLLGLGSLGFGIIPLTAGTPDYFTSYFPTIVVFGAGLGLLVAPLTATVMGSAPQDSAGVASGVNNAIARSAGALVTAVFSVLLVSVFSSVLADSGRTVLDSDTYAQLQTQAVYLMSASVPSDNAEVLAQVETLKREAYHQAFVGVMVASASLCFLGAGIAFFSVGRKTKEA